MSESSIDRGSRWAGRRDAGLAGPSGRRADGFTFIGLMALIAVINIGLGVAATSWTVIGKRAKEAELIWRGQQYVRALQCHQRQTGALPERLDELLESNCIRALHPEPMEPERGWRVIRQSDLGGEAAAAPGEVGAGPFSAGIPIAGPAGGRSAPSAGRAVPGTGGVSGSGPGSAAGQRGAAGPGVQNDTTRALYERLQQLTDRLRQDAVARTGNAIVGVASYSTDVALRLVDGESTYDAWRFVVR